ncbi:MAG: hypothetical protein KY445_16605, partial [Armatimonadetes bacterium]|nr:hypothetical protein [Armatimonadota bacterium]
FLGASLGVVLGVVAGFVLPPLFYKLTNPEILQDGQWGMIYLASLPVGAGLGAFVGLLAGVWMAWRTRSVSE